MLNTVVDATTPPPQRFSSEEQQQPPLPEVYDKVQRTARSPCRPAGPPAGPGGVLRCGATLRDRRSGRDAVGAERRRCTHGYD